MAKYRRAHLYPLFFLFIFFLHLRHLIRQLPKSGSSFFLSGLPPHPGLPERFQFEQNWRSFRLGLGIDIVVHVINVTRHNFQNSNLPTIRIISAGLTSDACLETWTFPIYKTNRPNYLNRTIYCCLGSTLNSIDKRPDWQYCAYKVLKLLTVPIVKVQKWEYLTLLVPSSE